MSTQSSNGVVSLSFRPGSARTSRSPLIPPVRLRVVISPTTEPWVQYGGGVSLKPAEASHVFSAAAY
jgi:hypothetical protein